MSQTLKSDQISLDLSSVQTASAHSNADSVGVVSTPTDDAERTGYSSMSLPLIDVQGLSKRFYLKRTRLFGPHAQLDVLKDIRLVIHEGETVGLVGESGSGKSTIGNCIGGLLSVPSETVYYKGTPLEQLKGSDFKAYRRDVQFIFQSPYESLNHRLTIAELIREPIRIHRLYPTVEEENQAIKQLLEDVGLSTDLWKAYPRQLSGGQCQRVAIARALSIQPKLIICDEAVSALDVSVQATVLNLLEQLKSKYKVSYLFISHDLGVVRAIADRVLVLEKGILVEEGSAYDVFQRPKHPYTKKLLDAFPEDF